MIILSDRAVAIDGVKVPIEDLDETFRQVPGGHLVYLNAVKSDKVARSSGYTTLGLLAGGLILIAVDNTNGRYCDTFCFTTGDVIGFFAIAFGVPIVGTAALLTRGKAKRRLRHAVQLYNQYVLEDVSINTSPSLHVGFTSNGFGFVVTF